MNHIATMKCENCGSSNARYVERSKVVGRGQNLFVVEDVPMIDCDDCGQSFLTAEVSQALDVAVYDIKNGGIGSTMVRPICVVPFTMYSEHQPRRSVSRRNTKIKK